MASGLGVNALILAAGAFVGGLMIGGAVPRAQVRELEAELFEQQRDCARDGGVAGGLSELIGRALEESPEADRSAQPAGEHAQAPPRTAGEPATSEEGALLEGEVPPEAPTTPEQELAMMRDTLALRSTQARAALFEAVSPNEDQARALDLAIGEMNDQLIDLSYELIAVTKERGEPDRRTLMQVGADALNILNDAETRMLESLTPEQVAELSEEATDPLSFLDPELVTPLREIAATVER